MADLIERLQKHILPYDDIAPTTEGYWWLAFEGDRTVAFAGLYPSAQVAGRGYLCRAGVLRSHRGLGLQRRLIHARVRKARSLGWHSVVTDTQPYNVPSSNSLIRCGFKLYRPDHLYAGEETLYWKKDL
ncbi:MAG: GNAT family N-acetyltransferase [Ferrovibrio sp.]|uniref:GNAT family N-acetyltransferase n=1 Tax=Ferrovibrio sp. TaxID=1917215 RepID=UPI00391A9B6B